MSIDHKDDLFGLLVDAVSDYAIFALDPNGIILSWNLGAKRLKGYEASEVIGTHFSRFYTKDDIDRSHPQFELKVALENGTYEEEGWRIKKDGSRFWANVVLTSLLDEEGVHRGFAKVTRDLTERKLSEDNLRKANQNLEERVRLRTAELAQAKEDAENAVSARDEFLSIASHELKTPLTSLQLQIQTRQRQLEKGNFSNFTLEKFKFMVDQDMKQIVRINRLVDDMLEITQISSGKLSLQKEPADLGMLVEDVLRRFGAQFEEKNIKVITRIDKNVTGNWDIHRIEQVFINLVTNAIKYGNDTPIDIIVQKSAGKAQLSVSDTGLGIRKEDHERIFQQFERAVSASSISGLGLGLYIVNKLIKSHDGSIYLESELGKGSTFVVELPYS